MSSAHTLSQPDRSGSDDEAFGSFELDAIFSGDQPLTAVQQALAIEFLGRSEQIQLERLHCIVDGATLAAEQVQDVRLDLLEQGPEVSTQDVLVDIFIGFLLDSSVPGKILKGFASYTAKGMVRRHTLLARTRAAEILKNPKLLNNLHPAGSPMRSQNMAIIERALDAELKAKEYLPMANTWRGMAAREAAIAATKASDAVAKGAARAATADGVKNATALSKAGYKGYKSKSEKPLRIDGDTPGVALLGSVQEFMSNSRMVVQFQYRRMETLIKIGEMTGAEARVFLRLAEFEAVEDSLKSIRDRCKLLFEAIIWAGIFKFDSDTYRKITARDGIKNVDKRLVSYWIRRFGDDIKEWNNNPGFMTVEARDVHIIDDWNKVERLNQEFHILRYFGKLLSELPQTLSDADALISDFDPTAKRK